MPERRLIDTNVIAYFLRRDSRAALYEQHLDGYEHVISFVTLGELLRWPRERNWGASRTATHRRYLQTSYVIEYVDDDLCDAWAEVMDQSRRRGAPLSPADSWIVATAWLRQIPVVSHNRRDFDNIPGVTLISEAP
jgi:tRNA(fMet)-specific endonuclease VapC